MKTIVGDILQVGRGGIICHQVNCRKVAWRGLAKQIRDQISGWYGTFKTINGNLGEVWYYHYGDTVIASIYAQGGYGTDKQHTDYRAMKECLGRVARYADRSPDKIVYIPHGLGSGLGGGSWPVVLDIIRETIPDAIIVKLEDK